MSSLYDGLVRLDPEQFARLAPTLQPDLTPEQGARLRALDAEPRSGPPDEGTVEEADPPDESVSAILAIRGGNPKWPRVRCAGDARGFCVCAGAERRYCSRRAAWPETEDQHTELERLEADLRELKKRERSPVWLAKVGRRRPCPGCGRRFAPSALAPNAADLNVCPGCREAEKKLASV